MTSYIERASRFIYYYIFFIVGVVTFILLMGMFGLVGLIAWVIVVVVLVIWAARRRKRMFESPKSNLLVAYDRSYLPNYLLLFIFSIFSPIPPIPNDT